MIGCIVVDLINSAWEDLDDLFNTMITDNRIEIHVHKKRMVFIYIYEVEQMKVWQVVLNLEATQIPVGFGFGKQKDIAKKESLDRLKLITKMNNH